VQVKPATATQSEVAYENVAIMRTVNVRTIGKVGLNDLERRLMTYPTVVNVTIAKYKDVCMDNQHAAQNMQLEQKQSQSTSPF
jgi:hypothetical protein